MSEKGIGNDWLVEGREVKTLRCTLDGADTWFGYFHNNLVCPVCGFDYVSVEDGGRVPSDNFYKAGWGGRGDLVFLEAEGECGHRWWICFGFHKGQTTAFVIIQPKMED